MASPPRLSPHTEHRFLKLVCGLPPRVQRLLFGKPPTIDGQTLAIEVHAMLRLAEMAGTNSYTNGLEPPEARKLLRHGALTSQGPRPIPMARVDATEIPTAAGTLQARHYMPIGIPGGTPPPLLVFFHAGGFVLGDLDTHDGVCRFLAAAAGVAVLSVDYRLAPEHPFPAAVEDAWDSFVWATENAAALGADPNRVAVAGDSAGGNLSAVVALRARDAGGPTPAMQLLIYPVTDSDPESRSRLLFADGFLLTKEDIDRFEHYYLPPDTDLDDPRVSVLRAPDLSGLAPAYVATAGFDPLRDEGEAYALAMQEAGTRVALRRYPGLIHGFANQAEVSRSSRAAMFEIAGALRMGLAPVQATAALAPSAS
jgi:acetyl esterase